MRCIYELAGLSGRLGTDEGLEDGQEVPLTENLTQRAGEQGVEMDLKLI